MRKIKIKLGLETKCCWLLAAGCWIISSQIVFAQSEKKLIRDGNKLYEKKKFSDAEVAYRKSLNKNQKSKEGNFNLGDAYYKQGKFEEAVKQFESVNSQSADNKTKAAAMHNLGNSFIQSKKYQEGVDAYKQALKLNPKDEDTRYNLAYAQSMLKQQQQQQQQQQQNQDKSQDKKDEQKQQPQDQKQEQKQQQEKQQQQQKKQISKEDAERILQALNNDEKNKHKKGKKAQAVKIDIEKDW